jgi:hypothetical protein
VQRLLPANQAGHSGLPGQYPKSPTSPNEWVSMKEVNETVDEIMKGIMPAAALVSKDRSLLTNSVER